MLQYKYLLSIKSYSITHVMCQYFSSFISYTISFPNGYILCVLLSPSLLHPSYYNTSPYSTFPTTSFRVLSIKYTPACFAYVKFVKLEILNFSFAFLTFAVIIIRHKILILNTIARDIAH